MNPNSPLTHEPPEPQEPPDTPSGEPIREHAFDGIREYDNPMPFWWTAIFWLTFAFSVPYFFYYTFGVGERVEQAYERDLGEFYEAQAAMLGDISADVPTLVSLSHDPKMRLAGQALFRSNCATCHGSDGGGGTGPNLTDDRYLNVREITDLHRVIRDGVVGKGMPEWGSSPPTWRDCAARRPRPRRPRRASRSPRGRRSRSRRGRRSPPRSSVRRRRRRSAPIAAREFEAPVRTVPAPQGDPKPWRAMD
jgi:cytochrome c oxidase cbb3-type subunit 3